MFLLYSRSREGNIVEQGGAALRWASDALKPGSSAKNSLISAKWYIFFDRFAGAFEAI